MSLLRDKSKFSPLEANRMLLVRSSPVAKVNLGELILMNLEEQVGQVWPHISTAI